MSKVQGWTTTKSFNGLMFSVLGQTEDEMKDNFSKIVMDIILAVNFLDLTDKEIKELKELNK